MEDFPVTMFSATSMASLSNLKSAAFLAKAALFSAYLASFDEFRVLLAD